MKALVNEKEVDSKLLQIPNMNYGQLERWSDFVALEYELTIDKKEFIKKTHSEFAEFRLNEIEEDDTNDIIELEEYKEIGRPDIEKLVNKHPKVLEGVLKFNDYLILHSVVSLPVPQSQFYYSINSLDSISVENDAVFLRGIVLRAIILNMLTTAFCLEKMPSLKLRPNKI